jgi:hypothetical protein
MVAAHQTNQERGTNIMTTLTTYKLFRTHNGKLYPLYVNANTETPVGVWIPAESGPRTDDGKVKSKLGKLAYRPGWHSSDLPLATHIGKKQADGTLAQAADTVWCECEVKCDVDYQIAANKRGTNKKGVLVHRNAQLDYIPVGGFYRYKTNSKMTGEWLISGEIKVNRILTDEEVAAICAAHGYAAQKKAA